MQKRIFRVRGVCLPFQFKINRNGGQAPDLQTIRAERDSAPTETVKVTAGRGTTKLRREEEEKGEEKRREEKRRERKKRSNGGRKGR